LFKEENEFIINLSAGKKQSIFGKTAFQPPTRLKKCA